MFKATKENDMNRKPLTWMAASLLSATIVTTGCKSKTATTPVQNAPGAVTNANGSVTVPAQPGAPAPGQAAPQQYAVRNSDGSVTNPDGSVTYPAGSTVAENESNPASVNMAPVPGGAPANNPAPANNTAPAPPVALTIPAGTPFTVRTNSTLSAHQNEVGDHWTGTLTRALAYHGATAFPAGTEVGGTVIASKGKGRFKGAGALGIEVTSIGRDHVSASEYEAIAKGRGKRSAAFTGGGAGLGALIGGLAGGGKGALIGGLAGGGGGAAAGSFTGSTDVVIHAETPITFRLLSPLTR